MLLGPADLRRAAAGKRLLGLDPGTKTIGVAVCDSAHMVATPLQVITRKKLAADLAALQQIIDETDAGGIVVGLPLNMDGTSGPRAQSVRAFQRSLERAFDLPMAFVDERLSTSAVERSLIEQDVSRRRRAAVIDAHAAAYILQGALDLKI
ncbi:MAG: Holliday junction resolvase RuvX [Minwuia sp.]|nr:Holliday junction resolvase RuvX [Minwuia sp.]